ncbi:hypothetical protein AM500_14590 [Bacillus sp. FJAT-18017]|nr:hypothetical protein AM500_14590 [Bacillus sp. FJAT-18017]
MGVFPSAFSYAMLLTPHIPLVKFITPNATLIALNQNFITLIGKFIAGINNSATFHIGCLIQSPSESG